MINPLQTIYIRIVIAAALIALFFFVRNAISYHSDQDADAAQLIHYTVPVNMEAV